MAICKVDGCSEEAKAHGFCPKHLYRFKKYGDPEKVSVVYGNPQKRIKSKIVVDENGCWLWQGATAPNGYGSTTHKDKQISAHRLSYIAFKGEIPDGMYVCHKCDVRNCVNPDHLFLGTHSDNMQDMVNKGRHPGPWNKGLERSHSKKWAKVLDKAKATRNTNHLKKCRDVYEYKNITKSTYMQLEEVFGICERQLVDRYKKYERYLKGGGANGRPKKMRCKN